VVQENHWIIGRRSRAQVATDPNMYPILQTRNIWPDHPSKSLRNKSDTAYGAPIDAIRCSGGLFPVVQAFHSTRRLKQEQSHLARYLAFHFTGLPG